MATKSKKDKNSQLLRLSQLLGSFLILMGGLLILGVIYLTQYPSIATSTKSIQLTLSSTEQINYPTQISFISLNKELNVEKGNYQYGTWRIAENSPTFLDSSGIPGEKGNVVIYGHNKDNVFAILSKVHPGDKVTVKTLDGQLFSYSVDWIKSIWPNQVEVLEQRDLQEITLFTCTGFFDSKRLVVHGSRV